MKCPLCLKEENELFYQDNVRSYRCCSVCHLVFVPSDYFLSAKDEKARYDLHQNSADNEGYVSFLSQLVRPMINYLHPKDTGLDFGSGPEPALASLFRDNGFNVRTYDPFYANTLDVLQDNYSFITATEVVEHLHHPSIVMEQLVGMLNPDGLLGIMTKSLPAKTTFRSWWYKNDLTHVCFFSEKTFRWIAEHWKLKIEYKSGDVIIFRKEQTLK